MLTALQWNDLFSDPNKNAGQVYGAVEVQAREVCNAVPPNETISTTELVNRLYPMAEVRGDGEKVRKMLFRILLATDRSTGKGKMLQDCRTRSSLARVVMKRKSFPWTWHASIGKTCPHCGGLL